MTKIKTDHNLLLHDLGLAALDYLKAKESTKKVKFDYQLARNSYLGRIDPSGNLRTKDVVEDPEFQSLTGYQYKAYLSARRVEYNAMRRLETRFRSLPVYLKGGDL